MLKCKFCEKECKNDNSLRNHERCCRSNPDRQIPSSKGREKALGLVGNCSFCGKELIKMNVKRHERSCGDNPDNPNLKTCPVCGTRFKGYSTTCSHACANTHFRSGEDHPNWKELDDSHYRKICFAHHEKKCVVCDENIIIDVHHLDENRENNSPENLIPMCPTHHKYWHSRYKGMVEDKVFEYISRWKDFKSVVSSVS